MAAAHHPPGRPDPLHGIPARRAARAAQGDRQDRAPRHRSPLPRRRRNLRPRRVPLRHPRQAAARALVPQQRRAHRAGRPARREGGGVLVRRRGAWVRRVHEPQQGGAASEHLPRQRPEGGHVRRGVDAVERLLPGAGAALHQQHPAARRRHASDRPARGDDAHAREVHRRTRGREEGEGRVHRRRHARRLDLRAVDQGAGAQVLVADQGQARLVGSPAGGGGDRGREADELPPRAAAGRPDHHRQDRRRRARARGGAQGARDDAPQRRARRVRAPRQARRLPGEGPEPVRALSRRGRLGRRLGEAGPRPQVPGDPAAQGQDPERRAGAVRQADLVRRDRDPDHRARDRHQGRLQPRQAALPPHHHHDGRRRRRRPHPDAAAHLLLPADAGADRARAHLHRAAAAVQGEGRPGGALPQGRPRARPVHAAAGARRRGAPSARGRGADRGRSARAARPRLSARRGGDQPPRPADRQPRRCTRACAAPRSTSATPSGRAPAPNGSRRCSSPTA